MQDFDSLLFGKDSIVNVQRRMQDTARAGKAFDGFAQARKATEDIDVIQERGDESLGCRRMILPGPRKNVPQIVSAGRV